MCPIFPEDVQQIIERKCSFLFPGKTQCHNPAYKNFAFCKDHLLIISKSNINEVFYGLVMYKTGLNVEQLVFSARLIEDLDIDSLTITDIIGAVEDNFEIEIDTEQEDNFKTVEDVISYLYTMLIDSEKYFLKDKFDPEKMVLSKERRYKRLINSLLDKEPFTEYLKVFKISRNDIFDVIYYTLNQNWIEHVTHVPLVLENNIILNTHILILTKNNLFYLFLENKRIVWQLFDIHDLIIRPEFHFNENFIEKVVIFSDIKNEHSGRNHQEIVKNLPFRLEFKEAAGIAETIKFLRKYYSFL